ncbi:hypothetical protein Tco_1308316 [Tanacetum coccineum]
MISQHSVEIQVPSISFPHRLRKEKEEAQQQKFLENLKQLHINIPFIIAIVQMPEYAKFLKSLLTNKSKLEEACTVTMNERCFAVLLNKLPSKEKDPGSFTSPFHIGEQQNDGPGKVRNEHLYSASTNEIDENKPELKSLPSHLEYSYLNGD